MDGVDCLLSVVTPLNNPAILHNQEGTTIHCNWFTQFPTKKLHIHRGSATRLMLDEYEVAVDGPPCGLGVISPWYHLAEVLDLVQKLFFSLPFEATVVFKVHIFGHKLADCFGVDVVVCLEKSIRECQTLLGVHVICERRSQAELGEIFGVSRNMGNTIGSDARV